MSARRTMSITLCTISHIHCVSRVASCFSVACPPAQPESAASLTVAAMGVSSPVVARDRLSAGLWAGATS